MPTKTVLVVEDDPLVRATAVAVFEDDGIPVLPFNNADDALAHVYEHWADVSAIFTDLQMPGSMDGLILAEMVGRHWPDVIVILTSGRVKPMSPLPSNVHFLSKPWKAAQVLAAVKAATSAA